MVDLNEIIDTPNISEEERQDMLKKSMYSLPDNPHKNGYNANEIKKRGWQYALGLNNSLFSKINEINESHNAKEQILKEQSNETIEELSGKVDKVEGKCLSTNDFDDNYKAKLDSINYLKVTSDISEFQSFIPATVSVNNQLADKAFVNSSIATNTATFRGTFASISSFPSTNIDENDYVFLETNDSLGNRKFDRYKYSNNSWVYEYTLNNSSFTEGQWGAINSGLTAEELYNIKNRISDLEDVFQDGQSIAEQIIDEALESDY